MTATHLVITFRDDTPPPVLHPFHRKRMHGDTDARCHHDMLIFDGRSTCGICLGLPDVPPLEAVDWVDADPDPLALRWGVSDRAQECIRCATSIPAGKPVAYSPADRGPVGTCCEVLAP